MVKPIVVSAAVVLLGSLVLTILAIVKLVPFIIWLAVAAPLFFGVLGFAVALAAAVAGVISEENLKKFIPFGSGAASGVTIVKVNEWWSKMNQFLQNPTPDIGVFVVGVSLLFSLVGICAGLYVGLQRKPALQQLAAQSGKTVLAAGSGALIRALLLD